MTRAELTRLAVAALGEGAEASVRKEASMYWANARISKLRGGYVHIEHPDKDTAMRALAAALRAIADGR